MQPIVVERYIQKNVKNKDFIGKQWVVSLKGEPFQVCDGGRSQEQQKFSSAPIQFWSRRNNKPIKGLVELTRIKTKHSIDDAMGRGAMDYAAPLYSEVIEQIPVGLLASVFAFEIDIKDFKRSNGMDEITTILYTKKTKRK